MITILPQGWALEVDLLQNSNVSKIQRSARSWYRSKAVAKFLGCETKNLRWEKNEKLKQF